MSVVYSLVEKCLRNMPGPHHLQMSQDNESLDIHVKKQNCLLGNLIWSADLQEVVGTATAHDPNSATTKWHK